MDSLEGLGLRGLSAEVTVVVQLLSIYGTSLPASLRAQEVGILDQ